MVPGAAELLGAGHGPHLGDVSQICERCCPVNSTFALRRIRALVEIVLTAVVVCRPDQMEW